ncbi:DNA-processing protein DprA [Microbacterium terricola]|uniref:DNA processing protein DprA n=1 Tax=Microbacterium terricola TaxID=344163 RepID=A0ABM8DZ40_9MICO|nr:DNA-processing protein DprA [Microbacterium terricola]UYK41390.1 DNA-processing protein DprA [Microbacterium terricola]BDV30826.1 DNA processing protein DprA [Microbacterium terricola]
MTAFALTPDAARSALRGVDRVDELPDETVVDRYARAVWNLLTEPGDSIAGRLIEAAGAAGALALTQDEESLLPGIEGVSPRALDEGLRRWRPRLVPDALADALRSATACGARMLLPGDPDWPTAVADLGPHAPHCLWVRGATAALRSASPAVALVGARAATGYGENVSAELAAELGGGGVSVVSGAAYGIDGAAHRATLAAGGRTVALLAGGVDRPYPAGHSDLLGRIAATGAVVSEVPCASAPTKWRFLQRNRLIAALADATVVVEAGWRSGSLNTAGHAAALGRPLGAVPGPVTSAASAGCHRLLREFGATCVTHADDVRELLGINGSVAPVGPGTRTDDTTRVIDALSPRAWQSTEALARRTGMSAAAVEPILGLLWLEGGAERTDQGWRAARVSR